MTLLFLADATSSDAATSAGAAVFILFMLGLGLFTWILPGIIAACRKHHNAAAIWITTLLTGWTGVGWLVAFVWAFTNPPPQSSITVNNLKS